MRSELRFKWQEQSAGFVVSSGAFGLAAATPAWFGEGEGGFGNECVLEVLGAQLRRQ